MNSTGPRPMHGDARYSPSPVERKDESITKTESGPVVYGYCDWCNGRFIRTVNDEPNRTWCGACPEGDKDMAVPSVKRHGYRRKIDVPEHLGTPKPCPKCSKWFAARPRETVCDGCVPAEKRTLRALKAPPGTRIPGPPSRRGERAGQRGVKTGFREVFSEYLNLTFRCPVNDPRAARLECLVLAYEEAARQRWEIGRTPVMPESLTSLETALRALQEVAIPYDPQTEMQGIRRPKWRMSKDRSAWGIPPTWEEWQQIQQDGKTNVPVPDDNDNLKES